MRLFTAEALILDVFDLHDRDRIVTFLTREQGKKKGVAQGAKTKHSRFQGQLQPLAKVEITWFEKEGRDLGRLSSVELVRPAHRLQEDLDGILTGSYLADHVLEFAQENEASDLLYRLLDSTLEALIEGVDRDLGARYFEAWVLRLSGIFPSPQECPVCGQPFVGGAILPAGGDMLLCFNCGAGGSGIAGGGQEGRGGPGRLIVGPEALTFLRRIGRENLQTVALAAPGPQVLRQAEEVSCRVRRQFLQRELRSYEVIHKTRMGM
jgi:DNA repair protein RecO (recombination protein O)